MILMANQTKSPSNKSAPAAVDMGSVLLYPITTEKAIGMIELENKLLFVVEMRATKAQIKEEIERLFKVKVGSVNTKITPHGAKHAFIRLKEGKADDIATQLKIV
ncbi:50S ribosomal protein L23 [uncultured archaeon]|nr:50S ribosomal protein L23 [uncultured archaeon]